MRVTDIEHLAKKNEGKKVKVFNPMTEDFKATFHGKDYTVPKGEMKEFDYYVGHHVAKHLVDAILTKQSLPVDKEPKRTNLLKEILI